MDAIQFLLEEHQKVKTRFAEIERASGAQRAQMWEQMVPELKIHEEIEDTYLYGPLSEDPAASGTKLAGFEEHQDKDVAELEKKIEKLNSYDPASDKWLDQLRDVWKALAEHVREEEEEILPKVSQVWDRQKLEMSGRQMAAAKEEAMRDPHHYATMMSQRTTANKK